MELKIFYDGDCPFCQQYVKLLRLKSSVTTFELVDLRKATDSKALFTELGYDLDNGMVAQLDGVVHYGADAINTIAMLSTPSTWFNSANAILLRNRYTANFFYPLFRMIRWLTLLLLGKKTLAQETSGSYQQTLFSVFFSLFSIFHVGNYLFEYNRLMLHYDLFAVLICAAYLFFNPGSSRLLFLLMLASTVSTVMQAPVDSNHTMVRSIWLLGYWLSFIWCLVRSKQYHEIFTFSVVAGQGTLLVMYCFGIFHKINSDFLNPVYSCAVTLWNEMPAPLSSIDIGGLDYMTIYGTFIIEGLIIVALLTTKFRHLGIVTGIGFHLLLALSNYAMYISFTTLSICLHCLFISESSAKNIVNSFEFSLIVKRLNSVFFKFIMLCILVSFAYAAFLKSYTQVSILGMLVLLPFCYIIIKYGQTKKSASISLVSKRIGFLCTIIFFANCFMPYLGLKSAQSVNMFANLKLEDGQSNHLLISERWQYFNFLNDVVIITKMSSTLNTRLTMDKRFGEVYYGVLAALDNDPRLTISFIRDGILYENQSKQTLQSDIDSILFPKFFSKWFHFRPVYLESPQHCSV